MKNMAASRAGAKETSMDAAVAALLSERGATCCDLAKGAAANLIGLLECDRHTDCTLEMDT